MKLTNRFASVAALAAAGTMAATPLAAAELPRIVPPVAVAAPGIFDVDAVNADQYRYYRRNRVDAGDVIGAVVVLGTIAAVASAVGKSGRTRGDEYRYPQQRYPYPDQRYPGADGRYDYRTSAPEGRYDGGRGIDGAVDMCAREVERNARIETVDSATRSGDGWRVSGRLSTGAAFDCAIGSDGRIRNVDYGNGGGYRGSDAGGDAQWDDQRYAAARASHDGSMPSGADQAPIGDDGRYDTDPSPDFSG